MRGWSGKRLKATQMRFGEIVRRFQDMAVGYSYSLLRDRLRENLIDFVVDTLREHRPSRDPNFATSVIEMLKAAREGDWPRVKSLLLQKSQLRDGPRLAGKLSSDHGCKFGSSGNRSIALQCGG
jgi:hypothetical protein